MAQGRCRAVGHALKTQVAHRITAFNREVLQDPHVSYRSRYQGAFLYLERCDHGQVSRICRLEYTGTLDRWQFAIYKYSDERYDPDEWFFPGAEQVDGTIEGAMRAGLASYVDDVQLRRRILVGLNRQERLHALARALFFGRQGRFGDRSYEAQLNRASALSLVINAIIVWNTEYLAAAAAELARRGQPVPDAAWSHITPLHWAHIHLVGHYRVEEPAIVGRLRPLRVKRHEDDLGA